MSPFHPSEVKNTFAWRSFAWLPARLFGMPVHAQMRSSKATGSLTLFVLVPPAETLQVEIMCRQDEGESAELDDVDVSTQSKKSLVKMVNKLWNQDQISKLEERGLSIKADQKRARPALAHRILVMEGAPTTPPCPRDACRKVPTAVVTHRC